MFDPAKKMDPAFAPMTKMGSPFALQMEMTGSIDEMNWADPFRPDDTVPEHVKKAVIENLNTMAAHYTYPVGDQELREEVARHVCSKNGIQVTADNITISCGSDNLFSFTMKPFLTPGEKNEVMMPMPSYAHNFAVPPLIGGVSVPVPTYAEDGYKLRIDEFEKRVTDRTRLVVITHPNNPTSTVYTRENLMELADFVIRHDLVLIVDQAFEDTVFDGYEMVCPAALPGMAERTVVLGSLSKGMGLCGFRVAYVVAPVEISNVYQNTAVLFLGAPNTMAQAGALAALRDCSFMEDYRQEYMARARAIYDILSQVPGLKFQMPQSAFYFWIDVSHYGTDEEIVEYLAREAHVLVSGGAMFDEHKFIRLIYGSHKDREACLDAVRRIRDALLQYPGKAGN